MDVVWDARSEGPGMRQIVGFGDRSTGGGNFGKCGCTIVTNGEFAE